MVGSFCNSFFRQGKKTPSETGTASRPVLQLPVLDSPRPADAAVGREGALQLDAGVGDLHVVANRLALLGDQAESGDWDL